MALMASNSVGTDVRTGERILYLLKTKGPQAASALAQRLHLTAMAVRQHLYRFRAEGLVRFSDERRPVRGSDTLIEGVAVPSFSRLRECVLPRLLVLTKSNAGGDRLRKEADVEGA